MRKLLAIVVLVSAVGAVVWFKQHPRNSPADSPESASAQPSVAHSAPTTPDSTASVPTPDAPPPPLAPRLPGASATAPLVRPNTDPANPAPAAKAAPVTAASAASPDIRTDLEEVLTAIRDFRNSLGGNPVGTNAEITKALLGDNLKQIKMAIPTGSSLNGSGELCDRWGTPYFFHQLSGEKMEVRSAGPDRKMWTPDDRQM